MLNDLLLAACCFLSFVDSFEHGRKTMNFLKIYSFYLSFILVMATVRRYESMKIISLRLIFLQFAYFGTNLLIFSSSLGRAAVLINLNENVKVREEDQEKKGRMNMINNEDVRDRGEEKKGRKSKIKKPKK